MENPWVIDRFDIETDYLSRQAPGASRARRAKLIAKAPRITILAFAAINGSLLVVGAGALERIVFLITSLLAGWILIVVDAPLYVEFTLALWMFSPFIRRVADYHGGFREPSIVLLVPFLVTLISVFRLRGLLRPHTRRMILPLAFIACALLLGIDVGLLHGEMARSVQALVDWGTPICFGLYLAQLYPQYPRLKSAIQRSLLVCGCIIGIYGLYQFLVAPAWDCAWMKNIYIDLVPPSFGQPEPLGIRVFSTLNSPGVLSTYLMVILSVAVSQPGWKGLCVAAPVATAFLLSQDRTSWIGWLISMLFLLILPAKATAATLRRRVIWIIASVAVVSTFLLVTPPFDQILAQRLDTLSALDQDGSVAERIGEYKWVLNYMEREPLGMGIVSAPAFNRMPVDGGPMHLLLSYGWAGAVLFSSGFAILFFTMLFTPVPSDTLAAAARAVLCGLSFQFLSGNVLIGPQGILFWGCLGIFFSSTYYRAAHHSQTAVRYAHPTALRPAPMVES
jgi:O-Antigen ligase